ncbi:hypothetical protein GCM10011514_41220 [Emticicia aquatilis]|uniref:Uncharacterized protein n=1 Tax=Emticicia aquatilis TaxID=1537369 RepID=A0A916Z2G3_9BACT|nr:hypothetical protein [Emticicia aquatilis]GGD72892.1 hypothetical protein GCM10011514_41220 [Emticicia aquatilis]
MYSKIPFQQVIKQIGEEFFNDENPKFILTPDSICYYYNLNCKWIDIVNWEAFNFNSDFDFENKDLENLFQSLNFSYENSNLIIITNEEWKDKKEAFKTGINLFEFIEWYENYRNVNFYQPHDYIFYSLNNSEILFIHHEGKAAILTKSKLNFLSIT